MYSKYKYNNFKLNEQRIPASFLTGIGQAGNITINVEGDRFIVPVNLVNDGGANNVGGEYELLHQSWNIIKTHFVFEPGMTLVFTKDNNMEIWLMAFNRDGSNYTDSHFFGATQLHPIQPPIPPEDKGEPYIFFKRVKCISCYNYVSNYSL